MGYLFFSVEYPTEQTRTSYLQQVSPTFRSTTFALYQPLPASATIDDWKEMLKILQEYCPPALLLEENAHSLRPLKPNDENYEAFKGPKWNRPHTTQTGNPAIPPELAAFLGSTHGGSNEATPHYDHCANCTQKVAIVATKTTTSNDNDNDNDNDNEMSKTKKKHCSRCKIVQYCSRDCQAQHWKACHKKSCLAAEPHRTLFQALQTNDGFLVASEECQELSESFYECLKRQQDAHLLRSKKSMIEGFALYFQYAAKLGGCFVV